MFSKQLTQVWYPMTVCTNSWYQKKAIHKAGRQRQLWWAMMSYLNRLFNESSRLEISHWYSIYNINVIPWSSHSDRYPWQLRPWKRLATPSGRSLGESRIFQWQNPWNIFGGFSMVFPIKYGQLWGFPVNSPSNISNISNQSWPKKHVFFFSQDLTSESMHPLKVFFPFPEMFWSCHKMIHTAIGSVFKLHDFGFRGVSSVESAAIGGVSWLFQGADVALALRRVAIGILKQEVCSYTYNNGDCLQFSNKNILEDSGKFRHCLLFTSRMLSIAALRQLTWWILWAQIPSLHCFARRGTTTPRCSSATPTPWNPVGSWGSIAVVIVLIPFRKLWKPAQGDTYSCLSPRAAHSNLGNTSVFYLLCSAVSMLVVPLIQEGMWPLHPCFWALYHYFLGSWWRGGSEDPLLIWFKWLPRYCTTIPWTVPGLGSCKHKRILHLQELSHGMSWVCHGFVMGLSWVSHELSIIQRPDSARRRAGESMASGPWSSAEPVWRSMPWGTCSPLTQPGWWLA